MTQVGQSKYNDNYQKYEFEYKQLFVDSDNISKLDDKDLFYIADQLGLKGRNKMTANQIRDDLMSLTYQIFNFLTISPDQWFDLVISKESIIISDKNNEFFVTFLNGQLNGPATLILKPNGEEDEMELLIPEMYKLCTNYVQSIPR